MLPEISRVSIEVLAIKNFFFTCAGGNSILTVACKLWTQCLCECVFLHWNVNCCRMLNRANMQSRIETPNVKPMRWVAFLNWMCSGQNKTAPDFNVPQFNLFSDWKVKTQNILHGPWAATLTHADITAWHVGCQRVYRNDEWNMQAVHKLWPTTY